MFCSGAKCPHVFGLGRSVTAVFSTSNAEEISCKISSAGRKRLKEIRHVCEGTCKHCLARVLVGHLDLKCECKVSIGVPRLMASAKKLRIPARCSTSRPTREYFMKNASSFVSVRALTFGLANL